MEQALEDWEVDKTKPDPYCIPKSSKLASFYIHQEYLTQSNRCDARPSEVSDGRGGEREGGGRYNVYSQFQCQRILAAGHRNPEPSVSECGYHFCYAC